MLLFAFLGLQLRLNDRLPVNGTTILECYTMIAALISYTDLYDRLEPSGIISYLGALVDKHLSDCSCSVTQDDTRQSDVETAAACIYIFAYQAKGVGIKEGDLERCIRFSLRHQTSRGLNFQHLFLAIGNEL